MARACAARLGLIALVALAAACGRGEECPAAPGAGIPRGLCETVVNVALPDTLPAARGNRFAESADAAFLGHRMFFDARLSRSQNVRCASCHQSELKFQDAVPTPNGFPNVRRRTPSIINSAWLSRQFWDGRADSLWSQPLFALESPDEMDFTRLELAHAVVALYRDRYTAVFGPAPDLSDPVRFPARGAPGSPAWDNMAPADQEIVNRVAANVGKAFEAYERKAAARESRVDAFLRGDRTALNASETAGLGVFARAGCVACHAGPSLTDERYHSLGVPPKPGASPDRGRATGLAIELANPFSVRGAFADPPLPPADAGDPASQVGSPALEGAFRTPSLRNLKTMAPYGHDGSFPTLESVVDFHLAGGGPGSVDPLLKPQHLSPSDRDSLLAFLRALDGRYPSLPWSDWPRG